MRMIVLLMLTLCLLEILILSSWGAGHVPIEKEQGCLKDRTTKLSEEALNCVQRIKTKTKDKILIGKVERVEFTKGTLESLEALQRLLREKWSSLERRQQ